MATKLGGMVTYSEKLLTIKFWSRGLASSRDKQISFYLYYKSAYDNQTWNDNFPWWAPTYVTWPFDHAAL